MNEYIHKTLIYLQNNIYISIKYNLFASLQYVGVGQGVGDGQGSLAHCSPWGHKESDTTEKLKSSSVPSMSLSHSKYSKNAFWTDGQMDDE